ncbi:F-box protein At2g32560-like isoform X2 [Chenopodium quinoa]|uniref:F-box domain-containing protein n=1 Tax=Chenopodium quinoa TaxID=63459 RepID=A0A803KMF5_CHEQI|nr:F-box protein At2g32560-like isoform X2 [Chenopodium quinoa]
MLFLLVTGISFFFFFLNSLSLKPLPPWASDVRFLPLCFWKELSFSPICKALRKGIFGVFWDLPFSSIIMAIKQGTFSSKFENVHENEQLSVLDLPELALDCILEKLSPAGLCSMAAVCSSLRERCISDHLWDRHMKHKWGRVLGPAASREWQWFIASRRNSSVSAGKKSQGFMKYIWYAWPLTWFASKFDKSNNKDSASPLVDTVMSWFLALESGKFWFPAQVYNRENGHFGFMLSCYDAELSYDPQTDTFQARYPPHGRRAVAIESGIQWERLRAAPVDTPPHDLHASDCLNDLHPGDHIEIQWRRNKEFPYGWWYGVVGHLESCDGNENYCRCHSSDTVVLEFNQYTPGSRWRRTIVNRKDHREEGNEGDGFYGGIRKLHTNDEIATWKSVWPREILE